MIAGPMNSSFSLPFKNISADFVGKSVRDGGEMDAGRPACLHPCAAAAPGVHPAHHTGARHSAHERGRKAAPCNFATTHAQANQPCMHCVSASAFAARAPFAGVRARPLHKERSGPAQRGHTQPRGHGSAARLCFRLRLAGHRRQLRFLRGVPVLCRVATRRR